MLVTQNVLDVLKQIGLNLYERKLWVALLSRGTATAGELSELAKVPRSRSYDVLESLAEKGFVIVQTAKPLKYVAIAPGEALERAKKKMKQDFEIFADRINNLKSSPVLKELEKIHKTGVQLVEPGEMTGSLKGRHMMHQQMETMFKSAKNKISILTTSRGLNELHSNHSELLKRVSDKGVKIRIATPFNKESAETAKALKTIAEVRKLDNLQHIKSSVGGRFCIVDGKHVVLALTDDNEVHPTQDISFWAQSEHVAADILEPMFEMIWQHAEPL